MIHWAWLLLAASGGAVLGFFVAACLCQAKAADERAERIALAIRRRLEEAAKRDT